ncbi:MAG: helix-turn-helix transcriptional regulator [Acidobacteria bacterium]|nr:helix-turn-helix transcriptional regulator [Acidobacteriota bacterium]MBV9148203.1 helix-turn-helix transcriptional regulator [Acidobacteriota bacterium]MBV9435695.1 helix-turn-helix transcriptional regulator [Acidobacteriota bacterium]
MTTSHLSAISHAEDAIPGRRERRRRETRARIFEAAMRLFAQRGFANTPVEEITEAADVAKGTFFNYFPTKESILEALAERQIGVIKASELEAAAASSVYPVLHRMIHRLADKPSSSQLLVRSLIGVALTNNTLSKFIGRVLELGRSHLAKIIERGQELGEIRTDAPALELARVLQQSMMGTHMVWSISSRSDLDDCLDKTFAVVWRGIAVKSPVPGSANGSQKGKER